MGAVPQVLRPAVDPEGHSQLLTGSLATGVLTHLSLLFVPVGVGVITHLQLLSQYGLQLLGVIVLSTWIGMAVTALVLRRLLKHEQPAVLVQEAEHG